jgi:hypothetical protein
MLARPRGLTLITTRQCTASCDHCCFGCSPLLTERIPRERLRRLIDEAAQIPSIRNVHFSGGECFLLGNELLECVAHAASAGLSPRAITNGYWAKSITIATRQAEALKTAGLAVLAFSTGPMHLRYVPLKNVLTGARASALAGLKTAIYLEIFEGSYPQLNELAAEPQIADLISRGAISLYESPWIPSARGDGTANLQHPERFMRFLNHEREGCGSVMDTLTVTPSLDLLACCGFPMESIDDLRLGSVASRTVSDVLNHAKNDPLLAWIRVDGPEIIYEQARTLDPSVQPPMNSAHICMTCVALFKDRKAMRSVNRMCRNVEQRIWGSYASELLTQHALDAGLSEEATEAWLLRLSAPDTAADTAKAGEAARNAG